MPITFRCVCGRELVAPDDYAGKQIRCGLCGAIQVVPVASEPAPDYPAPESVPPPGPQAPPFGHPQGPPRYPWPQPGQVPYPPPPPYAPAQPRPYRPPYAGPPPLSSCAPRIYQRPEQLGRTTAIISLVFGTIGIGGHAFGCCLMFCGWVIIMLACSFTAVITGWIGVSSAVAPDVKANARLGRALGIIGLIAGIIFLILAQIPFLQKSLEMQGLG